MFRPLTGEDITPEEYEKYFSPFRDKIGEYLESNVLPELCSYIISTGYNMDALFTESFDIQLSIGFDLFNNSFENKDVIKDKVRNILKTKYNLEIVNEDPLEFKENK